MRGATRPAAAARTEPPNAACNLRINLPHPCICCKQRGELSLGGVGWWRRREGGKGAPCAPPCTRAPCAIMSLLLEACAEDRPASPSPCSRSEVTRSFRLFFSSLSQAAAATLPLPSSPLPLPAFPPPSLSLPPCVTARSWPDSNNGSGFSEPRARRRRARAQAHARTHAASANTDLTNDKGAEARRS